MRRQLWVTPRVVPSLVDFNSQPTLLNSPPIPRVSANIARFRSGTSFEETKLEHDIPGYTHEKFLYAVSRFRHGTEEVRRSREMVEESRRVFGDSEELRQILGSLDEIERLHETIRQGRTNGSIPSSTLPEAERERIIRGFRVVLANKDSRVTRAMDEIEREHKLVEEVLETVA
jgi:hypothetical protein